MQVTFDIPDDIAQQLVRRKAEVPQILALGMQELDANPSTGFSGLTGILEFLASLPPPTEVLKIRLSESAQSMVDGLLEKNRNEGLSLAEQQLWQQYEFVEHLVRIAKTQALIKLNESMNKAA
jgi:hypothetical protein